MNESLTAVIERNDTFDSDFVTEPYEVAWASEARWFFVPIGDYAGGSMELITEISPDGLNWCPLDDQTHQITGTTSSWSEREFGGWLRLRGSVKDSPVRGSLYLVLKS